MIVSLFIGIISLSIFVLVSLIWTFNSNAYALPVPIFEPLDHIYNITIGNQSYPIRYGFLPDNVTAVIKNMSADYDSKSIKVVIKDNSTTTEKKFFVIELPRNVINSNTTGVAGGCSSSFTSGSSPSWVQKHDLPYTIVVSVNSGSEVAAYNGTQYEECGRDARVLSVEYLNGQSTVSIQGTSMIPDFGLSLSALILAMAVAGVIGTTKVIRHKA